MKLFSIAYARFKRLPVTWRVGGGAVVGVLVLAAVARWLPDMKERMKFFTDSALGLLVFVIVAVQAYIYQWQAKIMGDSLRIGSQAYVCIGDIKVDLEKDRVFVEIENLGKVPASNIAVDILLTLKIPPKFKRKDAEFDAAYRFIGSELYAGNLPLTFRVPHNLWLGEEDIGLFKSGRADLLASGTIHFWDGFEPREIRHTPFAFVYRLTEKRFFPQYSMIPTDKQDTKSDDPNL